MPSKGRFDASFIGRRVEYTNRSGAKSMGTIRGLAEGTNFVDVAFDGGTRPVHYVPDDTLRLIDETESGASD